MNKKKANLPTDKDGAVVQYITIPVQVLDSIQLNGNDILVYVYLARRLPRIFPTISRLSSETNLARRTVIESLKKLEKHSAITRFKQGKKIFYRIYYHDCFIPDDAVKITYRENRSTKTF